MQLTLTIAPSEINLGETVTLTYSTSGADDTQIMADNLINPIDLGSGDQSGTVKLLPVVTGAFNASIVGSLFYNNNNGTANQQRSVVCQVN